MMIHSIEEMPNKDSRIFYVTKSGDGVTISTNDIVPRWNRFVYINDVYYWIYVSDIIELLCKHY